MKFLVFVLALCSFQSSHALEVKTPIKAPVAYITIKRLVAYSAGGYGAAIYMEKSRYRITAYKAFDLGDKVELQFPQYRNTESIDNEPFMFRSITPANRICKELGYKEASEKVITRTKYWSIGSPWAVYMEHRDVSMWDPEDENGRKAIEVLTCLKK